MSARSGDTLIASMTPYSASAAALGVMLAVAAVVAPYFGVGLYMTSGVWAAAAVDLAEGTFYRPLLSDLGYGGTRYFPLHFVLHAGLIRLGVGPIAAAHFLSYAAGLFMMGGLYRCLRQLDAPGSLAALCAVLSFSALCVYVCLYQLRPDLLAAAFSVWGLSFCIRPAAGGSRWVYAAAVCFLFAFLTKFTSVFGITAAVVYWMFAGRRGDAVRLAGVWAMLSAAALIVVHVASGGRALESLLASAAGNTTIRTVYMGPVRFISSARFDAAFLILIIVATYISVSRLRAGNRDILIYFFGLTLAATVIIASDIGSGINHFIDLQAAAALLVAAHVVRGRAGPVTRYVLPACGGIGVLALAAAVVAVDSYYPETRYEQQARIMELAGERGRPLLSDDPWIPILAGERPYVLDNYSVRTASKKNPAIAEDLFRKLDARFFRAAVLFYGNKAPRGPNRNENIEADARSRYYSWMLYPEGFYDRLTQNYTPVEFIGDYLVFLPR